MKALWASPYLTIAIQLIVCWFNPTLIEKGRWIMMILPMFILDFLLMHSGVFLGAFLENGMIKAHWQELAFLGVLYAVPTIGIAWLSKSPWVAVNFLQITGTRFAHFFMSDRKTYGETLSKQSMLGFFMLLLCFGVAAGLGALFNPPFSDREPLINDLYRQYGTSFSLGENVEKFGLFYLGLLLYYLGMSWIQAVVV